MPNYRYITPPHTPNTLQSLGEVCRTEKMHASGTNVISIARRVTLSLMGGGKKARRPINPSPSAQ